MPEQKQLFDPTPFYSLQETYLPADTPEEAAAVDALNDDEARELKRRRFEQIDQGVTDEQQFDDVRGAVEAARSNPPQAKHRLQSRFTVPKPDDLPYGMSREKYFEDVQKGVIEGVQNRRREYPKQELVVIHPDHTEINAGRLYIDLNRETNGTITLDGKPVWGVSSMTIHIEIGKPPEVQLNMWLEPNDERGKHA